MAESRISWAKRLAYATPAFALAIVGIPVYVYLPKFYSDVVGVPVALLGTIILAVRLFDALTDPLIGWVSDRTQSRWGRRRPYILLAALPLIVAIGLLFIPPNISGGPAATWFGVSLFLLFLCWTLVSVPYEALAPELTFDYDERTALLATREGALVAGTLVAASTPVLIDLALGLGSDPADQRTRFMTMALLYAPLILLSCVWCVAALREVTRTSVENLPGLEELRLMWMNRPFRLLLAAYIVSAIGSNLPATLILYYVEHVLQSARADFFLLLYFASGVLFLPLWVLTSKRFDKRLAWLAAILVNTGTFAGVWFLGPGDELAYGVLVVLSGIGLGGTLALPAAIQADVIDYHELLSGQRREGQYLGVWSVAKKLTAAVAVGLALQWLGWSGYRPGAAQGAETILALRLLYALIPCLCSFAALGFVWAYPISRNRHQAILNAVSQRQAGLPFTDPLRREDS
jgi:GPH family glycoside/pentoside/hexuronide:cation symporter